MMVLRVKLKPYQDTHRNGGDRRETGNTYSPLKFFGILSPKFAHKAHPSPLPKSKEQETNTRTLTAREESGQEIFLKVDAGEERDKHWGDKLFFDRKGTSWGETFLNTHTSSK